MIQKRGFSKLGALAGVTTLCVALGASTVMVQAQGTGTGTSTGGAGMTAGAGMALPNCAVTTASVGSMELTEFFGLPGGAASFGQSFGPLPTSGANGGTTTSGNGGGTTTNTNGGGTMTHAPLIVAQGTGTGTGTGGTTTGTGTPGNTGTTTTGTTGTGGTTTTGTGGTTTTGTTGTTGANGGGGASMSLAQTCIRLEVANPSPGSILQPGGYVVEGFAFDPLATQGQGAGISGVQVFLGDPDLGGMVLGSVDNTTSANSASSDAFGTSNSGAAAYGEQFSNAGFRLTVQIPSRVSSISQGNEALFISATALNGDRIGTVAVPIALNLPTAGATR